MKRRGRDDRVERYGWRWPLLECPDDDRDVREAGQFSTCNGREVRPQLDCRDLELPFRQRQRRLARSAPDLQHASAGTETGEVGQIIEQRGRVTRPGAVVELSRLIEYCPEWLTGALRHGPRA